MDKREGSKKEFAVVSVAFNGDDEVILSLRDGDSCGSFPSCSVRVSLSDWPSDNWPALGGVSFAGLQISILGGLLGIESVKIVDGQISADGRGRITLLAKMSD